MHLGEVRIATDAEVAASAAARAAAAAQAEAEAQVSLTTDYDITPSAKDRSMGLPIKCGVFSQAVQVQDPSTHFECQTLPVTGLVMSALFLPGTLVMRALCGLDIYGEAHSSGHDFFNFFGSSGYHEYKPLCSGAMGVLIPAVVNIAAWYGVYKLLSKGK